MIKVNNSISGTSRLRSLLSRGRYILLLSILTGLHLSAGNGWGALTASSRCITVTIPEGHIVEDGGNFTVYSSDISVNITIAATEDYELCSGPMAILLPLLPHSAEASKDCEDEDEETCGATITFEIMDFSGKLVPEDDFDGRSHVKVGLGEEGTVEVVLGDGADIDDLKPLTWSVSEGDAIALSNIDTDAGTADFTAGDEPGDVTLSLKDKDGNEFPLDVAVIAPSGVSMVACGKGNYGAADLGVWMANPTYLLPKDVSFSALEVGEGVCAPETTGAFDIPEENALNHPRWLSDAAVGEGNIATGCPVLGPNAPKAPECATKHYDYIWANQADINMGAGTFTWSIPWDYSIGSVSNEVFDTLDQVFTTDGNKKITVTKGGQSHSHTAN